jgi:predicted  nucleic acid-binding Zn-ribbon protein
MGFDWKQSTEDKIRKIERQISAALTELKHKERDIDELTLRLISLSKDVVDLKQEVRAVTTWADPTI